jgi:hypothetical protein
VTWRHVAGEGEGAGSAFRRSPTSADTYPVSVKPERADFFGGVSSPVGYVGLAWLTVCPDRLRLIHAPGFPPIDFGREAQAALVLNARQDGFSLKHPPDVAQIRQRRRGGIRITDPRGDLQLTAAHHVGLTFWSVNRPAVIPGLERFGWTVRNRSTALG